MSWSISTLIADSAVGQWLAPRAVPKDDLTEAIRSGNLEKCSEIIETTFNGVDHVDESGDSYLHQASFHGHVEVVRMLVDIGADIHAKGRKGYTPLHFAAARGHREVIEFLLENGADVRITNANGKNCYEVARIASVKQLLQPFLYKNADGEHYQEPEPVTTIPPIPPPTGVSSIDYGNADGFGTSHYHDPSHPDYNPAYAQKHRAHIASFAPPPTSAESTASFESPPTSYYQNGANNKQQRFVSYFGNEAPRSNQTGAVATANTSGYPVAAPSSALFEPSPVHSAPKSSNTEAQTPPAVQVSASTKNFAPRGVTIFTPSAVTTHNTP